jgi:hypothetical protein
VRTAGSTQSQAIQLQDLLEVCKQHLHFLAIIARLLVLVGRGDGTGDVAGGFIDAATILRISVFGQHLDFIGHLAQSDCLDR